MLVEHPTAQPLAGSNERVRPLLAAVLGVILTGLVLAAAKWPFTEQAVRQGLEVGSGRPVQIQKFRKTYFPPGCVAEGVSFLHHIHREKPPLITIQKLIIEGSYSSLLTFQHRVKHVDAVGFHVRIPPRGPDGQSHSVVPLGKRGSSLVIDRIKADNASIEFIPKQPGGEPYRLQIAKLALSGYGFDAPIAYRAVLKNSKPPGEIESSGTFGPWDPDQPGQTPVSGTFTYTHADLGVFHGIAGMLAAEGRFSGPLDRIAVEGSSRIPNFHVGHSSHTEDMVTGFHALVTGKNGDTLIENSTTHFGRTDVEASGSVTGNPGQKGKTADIDLSVNNGRIEDLLRMFVSAKTPPMSGHVSLRAKATLPPGPEHFLQKLAMHGDFGISGGKFANPTAQESLNRLGKSSRGESRKEEDADPGTELSNLKGHVVLQNGVATFSNVSFSLEGSVAQMKGTYNLLNHVVDLHGTLATQGKISDTTSGFKSLLLKTITPFFKKKQSARLVPIKITGTYEHPDVGLDFH